MNRWLLGVPFENIKNSVNLIDKKLVNLNMNSKTSLLTPTNLRKEIENMQNLWDHSKKGLIYPIILKIENFVISKEFLNLESESKLQSMKINEDNYYTNLNLKSLVYSQYSLITDKNKSRYIMQGIRLFEDIDLFYSSSEAYSKKVIKVSELSLYYLTIANRVTTVVIILLIFLQIVVGVIFSIKNGDRISKPILNAANKLINFVGESFEQRKSVRTEDEIAHLNSYVDLLINYYQKLSSIAKSFAIGDTSLTILPKSDKDVMGNAFLQINEYLNSLTMGANEIIQGNYSHKIVERSDKDILAKTYNNLSDSIVKLLEQTKEMARFESEIKAAAKIQSSVLPRRDEKLNGYDIAHISIAATEVGGDNYDFRSTKNGNWVSIGDVSGHGLEAGILALIAQSAFNYGVYLLENDIRDNPQIEMYEYVNKTLVLLSNLRAGSFSFMTQNYIFENNGNFFCAGAHEIGLLYKNDTEKVVELKELSGNVPFMGIITELSALSSKFEFTMQKDDVLLLYTDGLIEAKNGDGVQFDVKRVSDILSKVGKKSVEEIKNEIIAQLTEYCKDGDLKKYNNSFADDVTIVVLKKVS